MTLTRVYFTLGEGRKRNQISVGSCSEVSLPGKVLDKDFRLLNASIQAPSGLEEPCFLKRLPNGNLGTYIPIIYAVFKFYTILILLYKTRTKSKSTDD